MLLLWMLPLTSLHYALPVFAAPPLSRLSLVRPPTILPLNDTNEPRIYCDRSQQHVINREMLRECKSAIAFLPLAYPDTHTFGPGELLTVYRTPIRSTHGTRCEVKVDMVEGFSVDKASWVEVREAAWDVAATCLWAKRRVGFARVGERYGIRVDIIYHFVDSA